LQSFGNKSELLRRNRPKQFESSGNRLTDHRGGDGAMKDITRSVHRSAIRRYLLSVLLASILLVVGLGGWAATTQFSGAVVAPGTLSSNPTSRRCSILRAASSAACWSAKGTASKLATC